MQGMLSQSILQSPLVGAQKDRSVVFKSWNTVPGTLISAYNSSQVKFPVSITSFRSGASYARAIDDGAFPVGETLAEKYTALAGDTGHRFKLEKNLNYQVSSRRHGSVTSGGGLRTGNGPGCISEIYTTGVGYHLKPDTFVFGSSEATLDALGTSYITETQPLKSEADLLVSIAELLREGLPSFVLNQILSTGPGRRAKIRAAGGEYLNIVFGINPILSDIIKTYETIIRIDDIVDQWIRDNGAKVTRRRRKPRVVSVTDVSVNVSAPTIAGRLFTPNVSSGYNLSAWSGNPGGGWSFRRSGFVRTYEDISFSSAWEYDLSKLLVNNLPDIGFLNSSRPSLRDDLRLHALGLSPEDFSLETLWNLVPFSWMVDWFSNVGDVFANVRAFQTAGLSMTYGYTTSYAIHDGQYHWELYKVNELTASGDVAFTQKRVLRRRATPFGFNVSFASLSNSQVAILAALAATKL